MPIDKDSGFVEPDVVINGHDLAFGEIVTLRVAVSTFAIWLSAPSVRKSVGEGLADNYTSHLRAIESKMRDMA